MSAPSDPLVDAVAARLAPTLAATVAHLIDQAGAAQARRLVSVAQAAEMLDVSPTTVGDMCHRGDLEYVDGLGRGRKVVVTSIDAWIQARKRREDTPLAGVA